MNKELETPRFDNTAEDLNGIAHLNAKGVVQTKDGIPPLKEGRSLGPLLNQKIAQHNAKIDNLETLAWLEMVKNQLFDLQVMNFEYENLPEELDIIRVEKKLYEKGSTAWIRVDGTIYVVNYVQKEWNLYNEPTAIQVVEPKAESLNGRLFNVADGDVVIFDNNPYRQASFLNIQRYIRGLERTLYQIEVNLTKAAPKGLILPKNNKLETAFSEDGENPMADSLEWAINSEQTFYVLKGGEDVNLMEGQDQIFIPIELTDRTELLIKNFTFFKEQIKEAMGEAINIHQKKERVNSDEMAQQRGMAEKIKQSMFKCREIALDKINKTFSTNITIQLVDVEPQEEEGDED